MALAVADAMAEGQHLMVQAGTGTGKSLGYLVPAVLHGDRVVVATATLALQHQLVSKDIPAMVEAAAAELGEEPSYAVVKGRSNYACLHRVRDGVPDDQGALIDVPQGGLGEEVLRLRGWAEEAVESGGSGDRDEAPAHTDRAWRQVSVSHRECLGAAKCPYAAQCFAERSREHAQRSDIVVTNHSLLSIDAVEGVPVLPDYDVVVVDEAHELVDRVTTAETDELSAPMVERAGRRARNFVDGPEADNLEDAADVLRAALNDTGAGRLDVLPDAIGDAVALVRDAARAVFSAIPKDGDGVGEADAARQQARGMADETRQIAARLSANAEADVVWLAERDPTRGGNQLCVAPLQVWGALRARLLAEKTVVFTSATLTVGGGFEAMATSVGLKPSERTETAVGAAGTREATVDVDSAMAAETESDGDVAPEDLVLPWQGIDVGSPFDYARQGICYVARRLPAPGRDGIGEEHIEELATLLSAAGGRTLGLFSSRRAAEAAAETIRERLPHMTILCQGDGQLPHLKAEFIDNPAASLFGTLSLWQGVDVPGDTCRLVVIDRIPFPRPDDPLMSARARAVDRSGGSGFMAVSAAHAALLLAQGTGRLIRTTTDRGVVAILDPRLATARYGGFLRASLPPMWMTHERDTVLGALGRLQQADDGA